MSKLYKVDNNIKNKYGYKDEDFYLVRYQKKFFDILSKNHNKYIELFSAFERGVEKWMSEALYYKPDTTLTMDSYRKGSTMKLSKKRISYVFKFSRESCNSTFKKA